MSSFAPSRLIDLAALEAVVDDRVRQALAERDALPELLTVEAAAQLLSMSPRSVRDRISEGRLDAVLDGRRHRITRGALNDYIASLETCRQTTRRPPPKSRRRSPAEDRKEW